MDAMPPSNPTYGALDFIVRHGGWLAAVVGAAPLIAGIVAWFSGLSILFAALGLIASAVVFLMMRSYVELVRLVVDMLMPK